MSWDLYIVRGEIWSCHENEADYIGSDEWLKIIEEDDELSLYSQNGDYFAWWSGESSLDGPWLEWDEGMISTKCPDEALLGKMIQIAEKLSARVVDDDDRPYTHPDHLANPPWVKCNTETQTAADLDDDSDLDVVDNVSCDATPINKSESSIFAVIKKIFG